MKTSAQFSKCRKYRYELRRVWDETKPLVAFIGLNPSTADETQDDPTIRRCIGFAKDWGYGGIIMLNLFAYRSTDPKALLLVENPIGEDNDDFLIKSSEEAEVVVAAWGTHGKHFGRGDFVTHFMGESLKVLGLTKAGHPKHPLYLPKTLTPMNWEAK